VRPSAASTSSTIRRSHWTDPSSSGAGFLPMMGTLSVFEQYLDANQLKSSIQTMVDRCPVLASRVREGGRYVLDYREDSKLKGCEDLTGGVGFLEIHNLDDEKMDRFIEWHELSESSKLEKNNRQVNSIADLQLGITGLLDKAFSSAVKKSLADVDCTPGELQVLRGRNLQFPRTGSQTENNPFAPVWTVVLVHSVNKKYSAVYSVVNHNLFDGYGIFGLCKELGRVYSQGLAVYEEKRFLVFRSSREEGSSKPAPSFVDEQLSAVSVDKIYNADASDSDDSPHLGFSLLERELGVEQASNRLLFSTGFEAILARGQEVAGPDLPPSTINISTASCEEALAAEASARCSDEATPEADTGCIMLIINLSLQDVKTLKQHTSSLSSNDAIQSFLVGDVCGKQHRRFSQTTNVRFLPDEAKCNVPKNLLGNGMDLIHGDGGGPLHQYLRTAITRYRDEGGWRGAGGFHAAKMTTLDLNTWATFADTEECGFPREFGEVEGVQQDSFRLQSALVLAMADAFAPSAPSKTAESFKSEDLPTDTQWSLPAEPPMSPANKPFSLVTKPGPNCYSCLVNGVLLHGGVDGLRSKCEELLGWSAEVFQQRTVRL
jgi:hypothetical protein